MTKKNAISSEERLQEVLKQIQLRAQVRLGQTLTNGDLARLAGVHVRSIGDWKRGTYAPDPACAILELLSKVTEDDVAFILEYWRSTSPNAQETLGSQKSGTPRRTKAHSAKVTGKKLIE